MSALRRNFKPEKRNGLTTLEVVVAIAIWVMVAASIAVIFEQSLRVFKATSGRADAISQAQSAGDWLVRGIQQSPAIINAQAQSIAMLGPDLEYINYTWDSSNRTINRWDNANQSYLLAEGVNNLSFQYYDINNQLLNDPTNNSFSLKTVEIDITTENKGKEFKLNTVAGFEFDPGTPWVKTYAGVYNNTLLFLDYTPADEGYILAGRGGTGVSNYDFLGIKVDPLGGVTWAKRYDTGSVNDFCNFVKSASDNGFIFTGTISSVGGSSYSLDTLVIKTDSQGRVGPGADGVTWARDYGNSSTEYSYAVDEAGTGYIIGGFYSDGSQTDNQLIKVNSTGSIDWAKAYQGKNVTGVDFNEDLKVVRQTADGYIFAGTCFPWYVYQNDFLVVKTDATGAVGTGVAGTWAKAYGCRSSYPRDDWLYAMDFTQPDGGYILGGTTDSFNTYDFYVVKIDSSGNIQWIHTYGGSGNDDLRFLQQVDDGGYILGGYTWSFNATSDSLIIKTDSQGRVGPGANGTTWAKVFTGLDRLSSLHKGGGGSYVFGGSTTSFNLSREDFIVAKTNLLGNISACPYLQDVTASLIVKNYTNDGNPSNDDFTPDSAYPIDLLSSPYSFVVTNANLATWEYPNNSGDPDFTLTTRSSPADFNITVTPVCP